jgi:hypothetical protein
LSSFNYSTYGATNVNEISEILFTRDDLIHDLIAEKKRANPPPQDLS